MIQAMGGTANASTVDLSGMIFLLEIETAVDDPAQDIS
jgi:hypothetical protein